MMILAQYIEKKGGIFANLKNEYNDFYEQLFGDIQPKVIDNLLKQGYGLKVVADDLIDTSTADIIDMLYFKYSDIWVRAKEQIDNAVSDYSIDTPLKTTRTITESKNQNVVDKAFSYDSEEAVNDTAQDTNDTVNRTETENKNNGYTPLQNASYYFQFLENHNFIDMVCQDIVNFMCLPIF